MAKKGSAAPSVRMRRMLSSIHKVNPCTHVRESTGHLVAKDLIYCPS